MACEPFRRTRNTQARAEETLESGKRSSNELTMTADGMWETRSERNIHTIADLYRKAIADDSRNSAAYTGLAKAIVFCALNDIMDGPMAYPIAIEALRRMPQLDSEYLDTKCPAAWIELLFNRNWSQARAGFEEILSKRPTSFALAGMAACTLQKGGISEGPGVRVGGLAAQSISEFAGRISVLDGVQGGDFRHVRDLIAQIDPGAETEALICAVEALVLIQNGSVPESLGRIEKAASDFPQNHTLQGILGYAYGVSGETGKAKGKYTLLTHGSETNGDSHGYALAIVSMGSGQRPGCNPMA